MLQRVHAVLTVLLFLAVVVLGLELYGSQREATRAVQRVEGELASLAGLLESGLLAPAESPPAAEPPPEVDTAALLQALRERRPDARRALVTAGEGAAPGLLVILADPRESPELRAQAAGALGEIASPGSVELMISALGDGDARVRRAAAAALGAIGDPRALAPLHELARSDPYRGVDPETGRMGHLVRRDARRALLELLGAAPEPAPGDDDLDRPLRSAIELRLGELRAEQARYRPAHSRWAQIQTEVSALEEQLAFLPATELELALAALRSGEPDGYRRAVAQGEAAVAGLLGILAERALTGPVRARAADALGAIGSAEAVEPLIEALDDPHPGVRRRAALALGVLGDGRAVEPLAELVESDPYSETDPDTGAEQPVVQIDAARALKMLDPGD